MSGFDPAIPKMAPMEKFVQGQGPLNHVNENPPTEVALVRCSLGCRHDRSSANFYDVYRRK
jgi:hypothetical protein